MDSSSSTLGTSSHRSSFACLRCSERKVKCNRQNPCSACIKHKVQCIFRAPKPPRRQRTPAITEAWEERLRRYETLLRENGIDPDNTRAPASHPGDQNPNS